MEQIELDPLDEQIQILIQKMYAISDLPIDISKDEAGFRLKYKLVDKAIREFTETLAQQIKEKVETDA